MIEKAHKILIALAVFNNIFTVSHKHVWDDAVQISAPDVIFLCQTATCGAPGLENPYTIMKGTKSKKSPKYWKK